jgi:hypothetical protein
VFASIWRRVVSSAWPRTCKRYVATNTKQATGVIPQPHDIVVPQIGGIAQGLDLLLVGREAICQLTKNFQLGSGAGHRGHGDTLPRKTCRAVRRGSFVMAITKGARRLSSSKRALFL